MKNVVAFLLLSTTSFSLFSQEAIYQFDCPGYAGEVYQDRAVIKKKRYNAEPYVVVAYYKPENEDDDFKLTYKKFSHELVLTHISGEMSEVGYARYRDQITLNLNTNDLKDENAWMLTPIPFWKTINEYLVEGNTCKVPINKMKKEKELPYQIDWSIKDRS